MEAEVKMQEEDKKEFLRCLLASRPYKKTYTVLGEIQVTYQTLTMTESLLFDLVDGYVSRNLDTVGGEDVQSMVRMMFHRGCVKPDPAWEMVLDQAKKLYADMPVDLFRVHIRKFNQFIDEISKLRTEVQSENF